MLIIYVGLAYLLGSIPFGLLIARIWKIDIRRYGSGNIGATNVFRTLGVVPGLLVFLCDFFKGTLAVYIGFWASGNPLLVLLMGGAAIMGHMFSIFLGFKGGKGAATGLGVLAGIAPEIFLISFVLAAFLIYAGRYVSVATIFTSLTASILMFALSKPLPYGIVTSLLTLFIIIKHLPNIKRLMKGTEPKIGAKG